MIKQFIKIGGMAFMLFLLFSSGTAFAQDLSTLSNIFTPTSGDQSMVILKSLFGGLPNLGGAGTDIFQSSMLVFNSAILTIGGTLAGYHILSGLTMTAHDGTFLGKKFHSVFLPLRVAIGSALVMPVFSGYCIIQVLIMWVIIQGVGLADKVWTEFTSSSNLANVTSVSYNNPNVNKLAFDLVKAQMCMVVLNNSLGLNPVAAPKGSYTIEETTETSTNLLNGNKTIVYHFGNSQGSMGLSSDVCGTVTLTPYTTADATANTSSTSQSIGWTLGLTGPYTQTNINNINQANQTATEAMIADAATLANSSYSLIFTSFKNGTSPTSQDIQNFSNSVDAMVGKYNKTVQSAAASAMNTATPFADIASEASQDGWFLAGAWFMKLNVLQDRTQQAIASIPTSSSIESTTETLGEMGDLYMPQLQKLASTSIVSGDFGLTKAASNEGFIAGGGDMGAGVTKAISAVMNFSINDSDNPIMTLKRMGDWIFLVMGVLAAGKIATMIGGGKVAGAAISAALAASGVGATLTLILVPLLCFMFILAMTLSYVVPFMPFLIWIGAALSWLILACEALIAGPLWGVFIITNSDGIIGMEKRALKMLLGVFLRPMLMIFGMAISIILIQVVGTLINHIYSSVFTLTTSSSSIFAAIVGGVIAGPLIYFSIIFMLVKKLFGSIHLIPDQLMKWIDGETSNLERGSDTMVGGVIAAKQGLSSATDAAARGLGNGGGKGKDGGDTLAIAGGSNGSAGSAAQSTMTMATKQGNDGENSLLSQKENEVDEQKSKNALSNISNNHGELGKALGENETISSSSPSEKKDLLNGMDGLTQKSFDMLGGAGSKGGQAYGSHLAQSLRANPSMDKNEMIKSSNEATIKSFDTAYGQGASKVAANISTKANGQIDREALGNLASEYKSFSNDVSKSSNGNSDVVQKSLTQANMNAISQNPSNPKEMSVALGQSMNDVINKFEENVDK